MNSIKGINDMINTLHESYFNEFRVSELNYTIRDIKDHLMAVVTARVPNA